MASDLWRGTVTRVDASGHTYVKIPRRRDADYGPCEPLVGVALAKLDRVLVGFLEGDENLAVIVRKLP